MKKWIAALAAILLLSCPMTAFAAEADINQVPGNQGIEVYGSCQSSKDSVSYTHLTLPTT